jgi:CheY-like chemotaxis protein
MGARILVADDSVTIQKVVELTFSKEDFTLTQARTGADAVRKAKEMRPDLMLLDLVMPDMNGYDVCAALRAEPTLRTMPIILLTGTFESFDPQRGTQAGADDYVTKPFESQVLIGKVKQLLFAKAVNGAAAGPRPSVEAVTVKIGPTASEPAGRSVVPPLAPVSGVAAPPRVAPIPVQVPTASATPREDLWEMLEAPAQTPSPSATGVPQPATPAPAASPEIPVLDLASLDMGLASLPESALDAQPSATDTLILPRSLSLDDLLAASPAPPSPSSDKAIADEPVATGGVVELPAMEAPLLPMVDTGAAEPPPLSVDELLEAPADAFAEGGAPALELSDIEPGAFEEPVPPVMAETPVLLDLPGGPDILEELLPEQVSGRLAQEIEPAGLAEPAPVPAEEPPVIAETPVLLDLPGAPDILEELQPEQRPGGLAEAVPTELEPMTVADTASLDAPVSGWGPETAYPIQTTDEGEEPSVAEMVTAHAVAPPVEAEVFEEPDSAGVGAEAVTERVARDLRQELSEKLLDRFEKIVWEVVPDLAEILIAKEIERIRHLAEEEKLS